MEINIIIFSVWSFFVYFFGMGIGYLIWGVKKEKKCQKK
jgi:hypothetical protein